MALGQSVQLARLGDARELLKTLPAACVSAVVTDPPYEINQVGMSWDRTGIAFDPTLWAEVKRVLKPGGFVAAFSGTRTYHRLAVAAEDAGLQIKDMLVWAYATGKPKCPDLGKNHPELAGLAGGLKPALEPILLAQRPRTDAIPATLSQHGTGALATGACRTPEGLWPANLLVDEWQAETLDTLAGRPVSRVFFCPKPSRKEKDLGLESLPLLPVGSLSGRRDGSLAGPQPLGRNPHVTIKPLALMEWLVQLLTPLGGLVLDPFLGSGTTGCACARLGRDFLGSELDPAYHETACLRMAYWAKQAPVPVELPERMPQDAASVAG